MLGQWNCNSMIKLNKRFDQDIIVKDTILFVVLMYAGCIRRYSMYIHMWL